MASTELADTVAHLPLSRGVERVEHLDGREMLPHGARETTWRGPLLLVGEDELVGVLLRHRNTAEIMREREKREREREREKETKTEMETETIDRDSDSIKTVTVTKPL